MSKFDQSIFTILIVDDNPKNLQVLGKTLKQNDYKVEFAMDGYKALEWIGKKEFDLILLDVMMPEINGFEVCEKIRANEKYVDIPIVFLTAKTDRESVLSGFVYGGQDYIVKPFDVGELLARVKTHLELKYNKEQLKNVNQSLEKKVAERTKQLDEANKKLEKANAELVVLDKAKGDFLNIISHEIRTPLNGIMGFLQLLKQKNQAGDLSKLIAMLDKSVARLEEFALMALQITRLKTKKSGLELQKISINQLIDEGLSVFSEQIKHKKITVELDRPDDDLIIRGEFDLLKACIVNLIENSIKFSDDLGIIQIKTTQEDDMVICCIIDYGKGFSQKALDSLFKLFSPGEQFVDQNAGLGLALSKMIIDAHSGTIDARNNELGGANITLTFKSSEILVGNL